MNKEFFDIYLRPINICDTDNIIRWRNSENVKRYFIYQSDFTKEEHLKWMETKVGTGEVIQFIIVEKKTNNPIGSVYLRDIDNNNHKAEYGIYIGDEKNRSKGYGTQAAKLMIEYAFNKLHLHKLYLRVYADNKQAISSYKKAGFMLEGIARCDVCIQGKYRDLAWMSIINSNKYEEKQV